jgi:hypothetical protein
MRCARSRPWSRSRLGCRDGRARAFCQNDNLVGLAAGKPEDAAAHYDLAASLQASGQVEQAAHELEIAQKLDPKPTAPRCGTSIR